MHPTLHGKVEILNSFTLDESTKKSAKKFVILQPISRKKWQRNCDSPIQLFLKDKKNTEEIVILEWVSGKRCQELEILSQVKSAKKFVIL